MTVLPIAPDHQGKVRDIYDLGDELLIVASDRISAFDHILPDAIPHKGEVLTRLSLFWFQLMEDLVPNHLISASVEDLPPRFAPYADQLRGRFMLVRKARMFPVECVVRGYLAGSGLLDYQRDGAICGNRLPAGLSNSSRLPQPIFTPSSKAAIGQHDLPLDFQDCVELLGPDDAIALRRLSLAIYERAVEHARRCGIIIADSKFEFGVLDGCIILADELLTPDSSRFWPVETYQEGRDQICLDKQFVRNWLLANWDFQGEPPHLPQEVIRSTSDIYIQAYERLSGLLFRSDNDQ
ncbi:MAG: phosphoribosylaminoimidazolesuccinocarboxamide synthase [Coriobacteriales bacterium]|nr:phosphoribosylaminoimidazolesuccinocarboxamide synthase [Coriobacteriales bacterium]